MEKVSRVERFQMQTTFSFFGNIVSKRSPRRLSTPGKLPPGRCRVNVYSLEGLNRWRKWTGDLPNRPFSDFSVLTYPHPFPSLKNDWYYKNGTFCFVDSLLKMSVPQRVKLRLCRRRWMSWMQLELIIGVTRIWSKKKCLIQIRSTVSRCCQSRNNINLKIRHRCRFSKLFEAC